LYKIVVVPRAIFDGKIPSHFQLKLFESSVPEITHLKLVFNLEYFENNPHDS
jgi:hypothetical protein